MFDLLCQKIDILTISMNSRMDGIEKNLSQRIDSVEKNLNQRVDFLEESIDDKISHKVDKARLQVIMWILGTGLTVISLATTILIKVWK
ncbi:MAG: hypothetical protein HQL03_01190 [Nitrospirae bacterium]|nr:hypothetical protein [Nitrospirota bacterium]MBF0591988.1 hypothetical protein [Nitrospirota bacterium]